MRYLTLLLLMLLAIPAATTAQVCGDLNGDSDVDLADLSYLYGYLLGYTPAPSNPLMADVDGHVQITISDANRHFQWIMTGGGVSLECSGAQNYSFAQSSDTLFIPRSLDIPDGVDAVYLPLATSLRPGSHALYIPLLQQDPFGTSNFRLDSVLTDFPGQGLETALRIFNPLDTVRVMGCALELLDGSNQFITLKYVRTAPGVGQVRPMAVAINQYWRPSIERSSDLNVPVIVYTTIALPPDSLVSRPTSFTFTARAGKASQDTFNLSLSATGAEAPYALSTSDPWIQLVNYSGPGTTPANFRLTVSAEFLTAGNYSGSITVSSTDPEVVLDPVTIPVQVAVAPPIVFPSGDYNCDGVIDISDLARMIAYLILHTPLPAPCY